MNNEFTAVGPLIKLVVSTITRYHEMFLSRPIGEENKKAIQEANSTVAVWAPIL